MDISAIIAVVTTLASAIFFLGKSLEESKQTHKAVVELKGKIDAFIHESDRRTDRLETQVALHSKELFILMAEAYGESKASMMAGFDPE